MNKIQHLYCSTIQAGDNDRHEFHEGKLQELALSIKELGLAQPITVRPIAEGKYYEIIAGERRFRAISQILQWETIPAIVKEATDDEAAAIMLLENTARADLNPIDEARAYHKRLEAGWSMERLGSVGGVKEERINKRLTLLNLEANTIQPMVANGNFRLELAEICAKLSDHAKQLVAFRIYQRAVNGMKTSEFKKVVNELIGEETPQGLFDLEAFWVNQVTQEPRVKRGKLAKTHAPTRTDFPPITVTATDTVGSILDRTIAQLMAAGLTDDAATLGTLYETLVKTNFVSIPDAPLLGDLPNKSLA